MKFKTVQLTDIGNYRKSNQDYLDFVENKTGQALGIVCDGMGGHASGDVASKLAVTNFVALFKKANFKKMTDSDDIKSWLRRTVNEVLEVMIKYSNVHKKTLDMGTTLTAVLFLDTERAFVVNVGDSRTHKLNIENETLTQITIDQNLENTTTEEEKDQARNTMLYQRMTEQTFWKVLTSALGPKKQLKIDIYDAAPSGTWMLTTDGIHDYVDEEMVVATLLNEKMKMKRKGQLIIEDAKDNMSTDNLSILIIEAE
ncbi:PP2C family protein-serine/threonine phosphatase [Spiroplasma endosymbiont of Othius punctulatus]|uniref:PP2C family protein-serine/threonine phosphatase n=1 Tax=Spiroplasma endosymbiont of Othius punctulatus TaxID=3066289 RepID=UPI0030CF6D68